MASHYYSLWNAKRGRTYRLCYRDELCRTHLTRARLFGISRLQNWLWLCCLSYFRIWCEGEKRKEKSDSAKSSFTKRCQPEEHLSRVVLDISCQKYCCGKSSVMMSSLGSSQEVKTRVNSWVLAKGRLSLVQQSVRHRVPVCLTQASAVDWEKHSRRESNENATWEMRGKKCYFCPNRRKQGREVD